jgi:tetratricopeptide (TPR) repeat protein
MDKEETIASVNKLLQKGKLDKALSECHKAAYASRDAILFNLLGDIYVRSGHAKKAVGEYHKAAKLFIKERDSSKAIGIYRKVLNINPTDTASLISLGELNAERNLISDAIKYYISAAHELSRTKKSVEFLKVCKATLALDPDNAALKERIEGLQKSAGKDSKQHRKEGTPGG